MSTQKQLSVVYLEWTDSSSLSGWTNAKACKELNSAAPIKSIGWLVGETKKEITISAHWATDPDTCPHHSPMVIPKCAITKRRRVK